MKTEKDTRDSGRTPAAGSVSRRAKRTEMIGTLAIAAVVLLTAVVMGLIIRNVRTRQRAETADRPQEERPVQRADAKVDKASAEKGSTLMMWEPTEQVTEPAEQQRDFMEEMPEETEEPQETVAEQGDDVSDTEWGQWPQGQAAIPGGFDDGRWGDLVDFLNLTQEESERLREGLRLRQERWQSMSDEQRQSEMARMRDRWQQWQGMSDQERQGVIQGAMQRFEDWRRSGQVELPYFFMD